MTCSHQERERAEMKLELNGDELLLVIIGIVRRINPAMLKAEGDGFTVDFTPMIGKEELTSDEHLLVKIARGSGG